jgi:hypothetical protein
MGARCRVTRVSASQYWRGAGARAQASVNPKVETVEELQARRKRLHTGMCKLLRQDLAFKADQMLAECAANPGTRAIDVRAIWGHIAGQYSDLACAHEGVGADKFNQDAEYKRLMSEAIDGKALALLKMDVYLESAASRIDTAALDRIRDAPLADFALPQTLLPLRSGVTQFPWTAVVEDKSPEIDLGDWDAAPVPLTANELVAGALGSNSNIRAVTVKGAKLALGEGWATTRLEWADNAAVKALPATVALVLQNCSRLTSLDIRCDG